MEQLIEVVLPGVVEPEGLQLREGPLPQPAAGQVRVRMEATGVSFAEQQMRRGKYYDQPPFPFVPGYDLVGVVDEVGPGIDEALRGRRVAVLTKVGAWTSHAIVAADDVVAVPDGLDPTEAETLVVNGITGWQMLHRKARVGPGATILVHGANGGVGSTLVQLGRLAGARVLGTAAARHHDAVRALGATPIDYRTEDVVARVRALAPNGVDAVFDHVGGRSLIDSWSLLARGGTLVSYGTAATRDVQGSKQLPVLKILARVTLWNTMPNGRHAYFYNLWAGRKLTPGRFRQRLGSDLETVLNLLAQGQLTAQVAARLPLTRAAEALRLAESGSTTGKVVLVPAAG